MFRSYPRSMIRSQMPDTWRTLSTNISSANLMLRMPYLLTSRSISWMTRSGFQNRYEFTVSFSPSSLSPALNGAWMQQNEHLKGHPSVV